MEVGRLFTDEYREARKRRITRLRALLESGDYVMPSAERVAHCILYGRCRFGEGVIDENGVRLDLGQ